MCSICGCGQPDGTGTTIDGAPLHRHDAGPASLPGSAAGRDGGAHHHHHDTRLIRLEQDLLGENDRLAAANRAWLEAHDVLALNLVSSPGSGKTTLLARSAPPLLGQGPVGVIVGDQQTAHDAERLREAGVPAVQINTGRACHLDAHMVGHAVEHLVAGEAGGLEGGILLIENVGNLVCPAAFDLGEARRVVIVSVTEGEDKPLKYAPMFATADLMILSKIDLLPHLPFDVGRCLDHARQVQPAIEILQLSATTGEGIEAWLAWLERARAQVRPALAVT